MMTTQVFTERTRQFLESVLLENFGGDDEDIARSLNSLAKYNRGHWKSEKQARFLQRNLNPKHKSFHQQWLHVAKLDYVPDMEDPSELMTQILKKGLGKKPTKKSLKYIQFMLRAVNNKGAPGHPV